METGRIFACRAVSRVLRGVGRVAVVEDDTDRAFEVVRNLVHVVVSGVLAARVCSSHGDTRPLGVLGEACCARIVHVHVGVQAAPRAWLLRVHDGYRGGILLLEGEGCGDGLAVSVSAAHGDGDRGADSGVRTDGDGIAVIVAAGLAFGRGVLGASHVGGAQRHGRGVGLEACAAGRGHGSDVGLHVVEHADFARGRGAGGDLAAGDGERATVDLVGVGAVVKLGGQAGQRLLVAHVHHGHAIGVGVAVGLVALDHEAGVVVAVAQILGGVLVVHRVAEVVDRSDLRVLPGGRAGVAELCLLGELGVGAAGADRAIEVQGHGVGA